MRVTHFKTAIPEKVAVKTTKVFQELYTIDTVNKSQIT